MSTVDPAKPRHGDYLPTKNKRLSPLHPCSRHSRRAQKASQTPKHLDGAGTDKADEAPIEEAIPMVDAVAVKVEAKVEAKTMHQHKVTQPIGSTKPQRTVNQNSSTSTARLSSGVSIMACGQVTNLRTAT